MDTGEFLAIQVPEDQLRIYNVEAKERIDELADALGEVSKRAHKSWHDKNVKWGDCPYNTCREANRALAHNY